MSYARGGLTRVARDALMCTLAVLLAGAAAAVAAPAPARTAAAPGAPGALSHFDLARKDCVGTARNTTSKVWFTVADGVLSDVYEPTSTRPTSRPCSSSSPTVDVHRPAVARHDLHGPRRPDRHGLHGHVARPATTR